jgi:hypothetical protein
MRELTEDSMATILAELEHANTNLMVLRQAADVDPQLQGAANAASDHLNRAIGRLEYFAELRP